MLGSLVFCGGAARECKKPHGWYRRKNGSRRLRWLVRRYGEADSRPAALGGHGGGRLLRGKWRQAVDMDCVLPVSHLKFEEAAAFLERGALSVAMGLPIFRSAHAGAAALAAVQTGLGIW